MQIIVKEFLKKHHIDDKIIAVGVSGGADSLALAVWAAENAEECGVKIVAITVDHKLRAESTSEAKYVGKIMQNIGIEHHILTWEGEKPDTGIEEAARIARYNLLKNYCFANGIQSLMVAHHQLDQAETFFMRLQRGSGLDGLCGMSPVSYYEGLRILRPFLQIPPQKLKDFLNKRKIAWIEDSSNRNEDFLRVKIRNFLPIFSEKTGIEIEKITKTMETLARSKAYIDNQTEKFIKNHCHKIGNIAISAAQKTLLQTEDEIIYRFLAFACKTIGEKTYQPRAEDLIRLQEKIKKESFSGCTLSGCEIFKNQGKIWIIPENKTLPNPSKKEWEEFLLRNPSFKKQKICGKIKRILVGICGENE